MWSRFRNAKANLRGRKSSSTATQSAIPFRVGHPSDLDEVGKFLTAAGVGISVVDRSMKVVWFNDAIRAQLGHRTIGGHHCHTAYWRRSGSCPDCLSLLVFRTGEAQQGIRERGPIGGPVGLYRVCSIPLSDRRGRLRWVAETLVKLPSLEFGSTVLHPPAVSAPAGSVALVVVDKAERIVSWSPVAETIFGFAVEEVLGKKVDIIVPASLGDEERTLGERTKAEGAVGSFETTRMAKDGRLVPVAAWTNLLRDEEGQIIGRYCWYKDTSTLQTLRRRVAEQARLLAHITHEVDDAILAVNLNGSVTSWNRGAERMLGKDSASTLGVPVGQATGSPLTAALVHRVAAGQPVGRASLVEWRDAAGEGVPVEVSATPLRSHDEATNGVALVARDVSERLRVDRQIVRSEKLAVVGSLAAGLAHEIGTPLNVISATAEYLMLDEAEGEARGRLRTIVAETDRINRLIHGLLSFAREEQASEEYAAVQSTLDRVLSLLHIPLAKKSVQISLSVDNDLPDVAVNPDSLHQLLLNLMVNAIAAVAQGGRVSVGARKEMSDCVVEVGDNGPGVPLPLRERVFDPFFTTRPDGTGLGLAVCARIVAQHGGDIRVETGALGGATFVVRLPLRLEAQ